MKLLNAFHSIKLMQQWFHQIMPAVAIVFLCNSSSSQVWNQTKPQLHAENCHLIHLVLLDDFHLKIWCSLISLGIKEQHQQQTCKGPILGFILQNKKTNTTELFLTHYFWWPSSAGAQAVVLTFCWYPSRSEIFASVFLETTGQLLLEALLHLVASYRVC